MADPSTFESFIDNCCSGELRDCFYNCEQIDQKLRTKANAGVTYNKYQIDAFIEELRALITYLQTQQVRMITGTEASRPAVTPTNKGVFHHDPTTNVLVVSDGTDEWLNLQRKLTTTQKSDLTTAISSATTISDLKSVLTSLVSLI